MPAKIVAGTLPRLGSREQFPLQIHLQMIRRRKAFVRPINSIHEKWHPRRSPFEKSHAQTRKTLKDAVKQDARGLDHDAEWMTQSTHREKISKGIHSELVMTAAMHRDSAVQLFGLFIDGPVHLGTQVVRQSFAVGWQHRPQHAQFCDRPM